MGSMFRSEKMVLCQLFIQPETAYSAVAAMGEAGVVQFRDLNSSVNAFHRKFVSEVRRCDELERKLRYIEAEVNKDKVFVPESTIIPNAPNPREMIDLETQLERNESEILELSHNAVNLKSNYLELLELKHVLEKTHQFFEELDQDYSLQDSSPVSSGNDSLTKALISEDSQQVIRGRLGFVAGVIPRERVPGFERMLWRISRGNVFLRRAELDEPLEDPATSNAIYKTVFVAFFQGEQLKSRVKKVCSGYHASFYNCPCAFSERQDMLKGVKTRIEDLNMVLNQTEDHRQRVLTTVASNLHNWSVMVKKMKAIYHTLNLFNMDVTKKCLIGECWVPANDVPFISKTLDDGGKAVGSSISSFLNVIETNENPPTFNRVNKFTVGFQNLIDSYGIASYREVNPALYSIVTFPFLFGIMFGDAGHGVLLTLFAAYMVIFERQLGKKKSNSEIWNIFFAGRYIVLLLGLFSIYTGIIYNDVFSKSVNIFGSSWSVTLDNHKLRTEPDFTLNPAVNYTQRPYPLGLDPVWQIAKNKIIFLNSYKMKLSIIFGVVHMIFGVSLSVVNYIYYKKKIYILLEFIPRLLFLVLLFFYLVSLMFIKWILYGPTNPEKKSPGCAPSVLILFINMMLFKHSDPPDGCDEFMFEKQGEIQMKFVIVALLCIPVMLAGKPLYLIYFRNRKQKRYSVSNGDLNQGIELQRREYPSPDDLPADVGSTLASGEGGGGGGIEGGGHDIEHGEVGEILIHQAIETIEYVLSTISHTASYLRLWALSLAHSQLSEVLWNMVLRKGLTIESNFASLILFLTFGAWSIFTVAILVMMEGLSAFLHTLRLHWVEFMSKFYTGEGYPFQPFSFKHILENEDAPVEES